jgi:hypothetical protein
MPTTELTRGSLLPHFQAATLEGGTLRYADLWQKSNLVLLVLPRGAAAEGLAYLSDLRERLAAAGAGDTAAAAVHGPVEGLPDPAVILSDRWGEVIDIQPIGDGAANWPAPGDVVDWVDFIRRRCPECPP